MTNKPVVGDEVWKVREKKLLGGYLKKVGKITAIRKVVLCQGELGGFYPKWLVTYERKLLWSKNGLSNVWIVRTSGRWFISTGDTHG